MMTIDDRGLFESSWGASKEITLADALREMDVHEAAPDTPIVVFPDPGQGSATAAPQEAYLNLIGTADRVIAAEHTAHAVCAADIEALMRALLDIGGIPPGHGAQGKAAEGRRNPQDRGQQDIAVGPGVPRVHRPDRRDRSMSTRQDHRERLNILYIFIRKRPLDEPGSARDE